jgi:hypothetical protein
MDLQGMARIEDELAVRSVLSEYCLRLEINEFAEWLDLFTDDCTYEIFRRTLHGRNEVADMLSQAPSGVHLGGPARVELDGDMATTVQNYLFVDGKTRESNMGWYYRTLVRTEGGWKIKHMSLKMHK